MCCTFSSCFAGAAPSAAACNWLIVNDTAHAAAGASMLGKKQKREFDRGVLHQVKAKPMKGPRIPANLGSSKPLLSARSRTEGVNASGLPDGSDQWPRMYIFMPRLPLGGTAGYRNTFGLDGACLLCMPADSE